MLAEQRTEDVLAWDDANLLHLKAQTIVMLFHADFTPASAVDAVSSGDLTALVHTSTGA